MRTRPEPSDHARAELAALARGGYEYAQIRARLAAGAEGLATAAEARWREIPAERPKLAWLLGMLGEDGGAALLRLLPTAEGDDAGRVLHELLHFPEVRVPSVELRRLLPVCSGAALALAGSSGDASLAPALAEHLERADVGWIAAVALGRLGATSYTPRVLAALDAATGTAISGYLSALEAMGDPAAIEPLVAMLGRHDPRRAFWIHHALARLAEPAPLVRLADGMSDADAWARSVAAAWAERSSSGPAPLVVALHDARSATIGVDRGGGALRIDYAPIGPSTSWPRWNKALYVGDRPLYEVSSDCGTCETVLSLAGPLDADARAALQAFRGRVAHLDALSEPALRELSPMLGELPTGHYSVALADLPLQLVSRPEEAWIVRRAGPPGDAPSERARDRWPGTAHFQATRALLDDKPATFLVLAPSQPLDACQEAIVDAHAEAIARGERPVALAWLWVEDRSDWTEEHPERFVLGLVLDGHHKLLAYARRGVPARVLSLAHAESCSVEGTDVAAIVRATLARIAT